MSIAPSLGLAGERRLPLAVPAPVMPVAVPRRNGPDGTAADCATAKMRSLYPGYRLVYPAIAVSTSLAQ